MVQVTELLPPTWKAWIELLAPGFGPVLSIWGVSQQTREEVFLFLCLSNKYRKHLSLSCCEKNVNAMCSFFIISIFH